MALEVEHALARQSAPAVTMRRRAGPMCCPAGRAFVAALGHSPHQSTPLAAPAAALAVALTAATAALAALAALLTLSARAVAAGLGLLEELAVLGLELVLARLKLFFLLSVFLKETHLLGGLDVSTVRSQCELS